MSGQILVITGTGTHIGKTVVTAGIAALAAAAGKSVAVVKPGQTGARDDDLGDVDDVRRLSGIEDAYELARFLDPLAPAAAARIAGTAPMDFAAATERIKEIAATHDLVLVEGAGGLLVEYDDARHTIADLAAALDAELVVVITPKLGVLNHTSLTLEVMANRGLRLAGLVIGSWPQDPDLACCSNLVDLEIIAGQPLSGAVRERAGRLGRTEFLAAVTADLAPRFGGRFDAADFQQRFEYRRNA